MEHSMVQHLFRADRTATNLIKAVVINADSFYERLEQYPNFQTDLKAQFDNLDKSSNKLKFNGKKITKKNDLFGLLRIAKINNLPTSELYEIISNYEYNMENKTKILKRTFDGDDIVLEGGEIKRIKN